MKLNTVKLQEISKEELQNVNGGRTIITGPIAWDFIKKYSKGPGPEMERQYKHGMPGGKW